MNIKSQAKAKGHSVVGALKRVKDDIFYRGEEEICYRQYVDAEGTLYAIDDRGILVYICGDDWCI